jgi:beta-lactamase class A
MFATCCRAASALFFLLPALSHAGTTLESPTAQSEQLSTVFFKARVTPDVARVDLLEGGARLGSLNANGGWSGSFRLPATGAHKVVLESVDVSGTVIQRSDVSFSTARFLAPSLKAQGVYVNGSPIPVSADPEVARIQIKAETFAIGGSSTRDAEQRFVISPNLMNQLGSRTLNLEALDAGGNVLQTRAVPIMVRNVQLLSPSNGVNLVSNSVFVLTAKAAPNTAKVDYFADTFLLQSMTNASEQYRRETSLQALGSRALRAVAWDASGNKLGEDSISVNVVASPPSAAQTALENAVTRARGKAVGAPLGVAAVNLQTGERLLVNADSIVNHASSAKWLFVAAALNKQSVATVQPQAVPTMRDSDNDAAGRLVDQAGGVAAVNAYAVANGIPQSGWSLCKWNFGKTRTDPNCNKGRQGTNFFTAKAAVIFLERVYKGQMLADTTKSNKLREWALLSPDTGYGGWVGTQLPASVKPTVQHKAGWVPAPEGFNTNNAIALIRTASGVPYAIAITAENGNSFSTTNTALSYLSCVVYRLFDTPSAPNTAACTL